LHIGLGKVHYEMNELTSAEEQLLRGVQMTAGGMHLVNAWGHALLAQTKLALGATGPLFDAQREASLEKYSGRFGMDVPPLSAAIAQVWLSQGRLDAVARWCKLARLPLEGSLAVGREAEYLVLARYFLVVQQFSDALALLAHLWEEAAMGRRVSVMVEIRILQALTLHARNDVGEALNALKHGVELAEKTGIVRLFIDGGLPICEMLKKLATDTHSTSHVHRLLGHVVNAMPADGVAPATINVPELSKKEQRVLQCLAQGMSNQKIAEALFVSPNTIKTHMRNIYSKLGVNNRLQAVDQLRKLGMS
jgi:LuxR family maltose regulon positive regulatory protein